jgi:glycosyltransferase involved in cell wall biosynthesis
MRIAILWPQSQDAWIAGSIYSENLLRSLMLLSDPTVEVFVLEPDGGDFTSSGGEARWGIQCLHHKPSPESRRGLFTKVASRLRRLAGMPGGDRSAVARRSRVDAVFGALDEPVRNSAPWVAWIPDFQHVHHPEFFSQEEISVRELTYHRWAEECSLMLLSSQDCAKDFKAFAPNHGAKARVVPFASLLNEEYFALTPEPVLARYGITERFVVVPNQWWRHKNHETALRAAKLLDDSGLEMDWVFTGAFKDYRSPAHSARMLELIEELGLSERVRLLGSIPRAEQIQILRAAELIVHPSLFEGWSTVVEDARTLGQRMVLSDIAVHREQNPPGALFFEPCSPGDLAEKVVATLGGATQRRNEDESRRESMERARGYARRFVDVCAEAGGVRS